MTPSMTFMSKAGLGVVGDDGADGRPRELTRDGSLTSSATAFAWNAPSELCHEMSGSPGSISAMSTALEDFRVSSEVGAAAAVARGSPRHFFLRRENRPESAWSFPPYAQHAPPVGTCPPMPHASSAEVKPGLAEPFADYPSLKQDVPQTCCLVFERSKLAPLRLPSKRSRDLALSSEAPSSSSPSTPRGSEFRLTPGRETKCPGAPKRRRMAPFQKSPITPIQFRLAL